MSTTPKPTGYAGVLTMDEVAKIASHYDPTGSMFGDITALAGSHERLWDVLTAVHDLILPFAGDLGAALIAAEAPNRLLDAVDEITAIVVDGRPVTPVFERLDYLEGEYDRLRKRLAGAGLEDETRG